MSKKVLIWGIVAVGVIILILGGINLYLYYQKQAREKTTETEGTEQSEEKTQATVGSLSSDGTGASPEELGIIEGELPRVVQISEKKIKGATLGKDKDRVYYFEVDTGLVFSASLAGAEEEQKTFTEIENLIDVEWNKDKNRAIVIRADDNDADGIRYDIYNIATEDMVTLPNFSEKVVWDKSGNKIVYFYDNPDKDTIDLSVANDKGQDYRVVKRLVRDELWITVIPGTDYVAISSLPTYQKEEEVRIINLSSGEEGVTGGKRKAPVIQWSEGGTYGFMQYTSDENDSEIVNYLIDSKRDKSTRLKTKTFADKVTWSSDGKYFYAAISEKIGTLVPDDYLSGSVTMKDVFFRVEISTGDVKQVTLGDEIEGELDATNLFLTEDSKKLFFTNQADNRLYVINL